MNRSAFLCSTVALAVLSGTLSSGCIAKDCEGENGQDAICLETPERYDGDDGFETIPYEPGLGVSIDGIYGDILVRDGAPGTVRVSFQPYAYAGQDEGDRARDAIEDKAEYPEPYVDGDVIVIQSGRTDSKIPLVGMDLTIELPPEFDGPIVTVNRGNGNWNPGDVDIDFVGFAPTVELKTDSLSNCEITGGPALTYTYARCGDSIDVLDANDTLDLESTGGFGDVRVAIASISPEAADSSIVAEDGKVQVIFPEGADFSVTAQATAPGIANFSDIEGTCEVAVSAETAKSATCGEGGPLYVLRSESEGVSVSLR